MHDDPLFASCPELRTSVRKIIHSKANQYSHYLHSSALFSKEDLVQEGWVVWQQLRRQRRYDANRSQLTTLLHAALVKRYNSILRYENQRCRRAAAGVVSLDAEQPPILKVAAHKTSPERLAMVLQALEALAEANSELGRLFVEGCPPALLAEARVNTRLRAQRLGISAVDAAVVINNKMIRKFFKINLAKLSKLANNYL